MNKNLKIIICGATASGKTALAIGLAQKLGAVIINADSQQVYKEIPILSAQPSTEEQQGILHELFGVMSGAEACNVARWLEMLNNQSSFNKLPSIIVGGTGMYLNALLHGLSPIPDIPQVIRTKVRGMDIAEVASLLGDKADGNNQRMRRALEVQLTTGKHISEFHSQPGQSSFNQDEFIILHKVVSRENLYEKINKRFISMVENGGMDEAKNLAALKLDPALPVMKACGVPELNAYLAGIISKEEAIAKAQQVSRNYAKRQLTWFRNQMPKSMANVTNLEEALAAVKNH